MDDAFDRRRNLRARFESADCVIERWDMHARENRTDVPSMDASPEALLASKTAEITVNVEWLAYMLTYAGEVR